MAKHVGVKLPEDLAGLLKSETTVGVLATFSERVCRILHLFNVFIQKGLKVF